jgi:uncharacterized SAM-binding protein YcdF (DUF218 family)
MFLILSKVLPLFVYPVGLASLLLLAGLVLGRRPRWRAACFGLALAVLVLFGNRWAAKGLARSLEWQYLPQDDPPAADVIVLLGGGTRAAEYPRLFTEVNEGGDRMMYAAQLYHLHKAPRILVSGGFIDWLGSDISEAEGMQEILGWLGVPAQDVVLEAISRNTYENAIYTRELLAPEQRRILLVTSALHMPRSVLIFRKQGFEVIPAPVDYMVTQSEEESVRGGGPGAWLYHMLPTAENLDLSTRSLREYIGIVVYRLQGWLYGWLARLKGMNDKVRGRQTANSQRNNAKKQRTQRKEERK